MAHRTFLALAAQRGDIEHPAAAVEKAMERSMVRQASARMRPRIAQLLVLRFSGLSYLVAAIGVSPFSSLSVPSTLMILYSVLYAVGFLGLAIWNFSRRDL